ncbi:dTMP kinase [Mycoplasmopsis pulmonis]|nr:dTMP kinase [Mycoplasmopsis pulmonis]VEU67844.1 thymidylate kinase [Mycoplasmopsis pulmonis]
MFITFEGIDASGKTSLLAKLKAHVVQKNLQGKCTFTWEPGGRKSPEIQTIRHLILNKESNLSPIAEAFLYSSARRIHLDKVILPNLAKNKVVFCDRFVDSSFAYQAFGRDLGFEKIKLLNELATDKKYPDITFILKISYEESMERRKARQEDEDRLEKEENSFYQKVIKGYDFLASYPEFQKRIFVIDASKNQEEIFESVLKILKDHKTFQTHPIYKDFFS